MPELIVFLGLLLLAFTAGFSVGASWERGKPIKQLNAELNDNFCSDYDGQ